MVFGDLLSDLYTEWEDCLIQSLSLPERTYFESILNGTATNDDLKKGLYKLSSFIAEKFHQRVIVLIDEYEAPNYCAYEDGYFAEVCSLNPSILTVVVKDKYSRPMSSLRAVYCLFS